MSLFCVLIWYCEESREKSLLFSCKKTGDKGKLYPYCVKQTGQGWVPGINERW